MTLQQIRQELKKSPKSAWYFVQGNIRLTIYKSRFKWLLRKHILEQFQYRKKAAQECYFMGACKCCGCATPGLFFAGKACSANKYDHCKEQGIEQCYPEMKSRKQWNKFKNHAAFQRVNQINR